MKYISKIGLKGLKITIQPSITLFVVQNFKKE